MMTTPSNPKLKRRESISEALAIVDAGSNLRNSAYISLNLNYDFIRLTS
jgi:hypothetical protein